MGALIWYSLKEEAQGAVEYTLILLVSLVVIGLLVSFIPLESK